MSAILYVLAAIFDSVRWGALWEVVTAEWMVASRNTSLPLNHVLRRLRSGNDDLGNLVLAEWCTLTGMCLAVFLMVVRPMDLAVRLYHAVSDLLWVAVELFLVYAVFHSHPIVQLVAGTAVLTLCFCKFMFEFRGAVWSNIDTVLLLAVAAQLVLEFYVWNSPQLRAARDYLWDL